MASKKRAIQGPTMKITGSPTMVAKSPVMVSKPVGMKVRGKSKGPAVARKARGRK